MQGGCISPVDNLPIEINNLNTKLVNFIANHVHKANAYKTANEIFYKFVELKGLVFFNISKEIVRKARKLNDLLSGISRHETMNKNAMQFIFKLVVQVAFQFAESLCVLGVSDFANYLYVHKVSSLNKGINDYFLLKYKKNWQSTVMSFCTGFIFKTKLVTQCSLVEIVNRYNTISERSMAILISNARLSNDNLGICIEMFSNPSFYLK